MTEPTDRLLRSGDGSEAGLNPDCQDRRGQAGWSCIEFDGTGLWCDSCLAASGAVQ